MRPSRIGVGAWRLVRVVPCGVLLTAAIARFAAAQCNYIVIEVTGPECPFSGPVGLSAWAINESGAVAGRYRQCVVSDWEAFVWSSETGVVTLPRPIGSMGAEALAMNDSGDVVGAFRPTGGLPRAALWRDGEFIDLGLLPGSNTCVAQGINNAGTVVGTCNNSVTGDPPLRAFIWQDEVMKSIDLPLGTYSTAYDIAEDGTVVGWMGKSPSIEARAYSWKNGVTVTIDPIPTGYTSVAYATNDRGDIVGQGYIAARGSPPWERYAARFQGAMAYNLGTIPGSNQSLAWDVNNLRQIVGYAELSLTPNRALLWTNGVVHDLNELVQYEPVLTSMRSINDRGHIVGVASPSDGGFVLLKPQRAPGDVNLDCVVDAMDFLDVLGAWGQCKDCLTDLSGDGVVNSTDLKVVLDHWSVF